MPSITVYVPMGLWRELERVTEDPAEAVRRYVKEWSPERVPAAGVSDRVVARHAGLVEGVSERVAAARRVPRSVMCEHRVPVGSFCKLCDS